MNPLEIQAVAIAKSVGVRFVKAGLSGAGAALVALTIATPQTWAQLSTALVTLAYVAIIGFFTGGIMAVEKYLNWTDTPSA